MASTLIVEDGTGKPDASSYTSAADLRAYALARGVTLAPSDTAGDALVDQMAIKAMDYIEANRRYFWGHRLTETQRLSFPREGVPGEVPGTYRPPSPLPFELIEAQSQLVLQVKAGVDLMPTQVSGKFVKRQKLGPLEREFSEAVGIYTLPQMPMVDALLGPLLTYGIGGGVTTAYRK